MNLHANRSLFADLVEESAKSLGIAPIFIEKDYWVTFILKRLSKSKYKDIAIFKGGTSLSKAYRIIDRFSEDVDIAIVDKGLSGNKLKQTIKNIEDELTHQIFTQVQMPQTSKGSKFRKTIHRYPQNIDGDFKHAKENILLELNAFANPYPIVSKMISSYIYDFLKDKEGGIIQTYSIEPFCVNVLDYVRTFCEKLSAIARATYEDDKNYTKLKEKIRHFYDIYFLMQEKKIQNFINTNEFIDMIKSVRAYDKVQFNDNDWAKIPLHQTQIFTSDGAILDKTINFYNHEFSALVYSKEKMPTMDKIKLEIEKISHILKSKKI